MSKTNVAAAAVVENLKLEFNDDNGIQLPKEVQKEPSMGEALGVKGASEALSYDPSKDTIETEVQKKFKKVGSLRPQRGHKLFFFNTNTGEMGVVPETRFVIRRGRKSLIVLEGYSYLTALNLKNAVKKIHKIINS